MQKFVVMVQADGEWHVNPKTFLTQVEAQADGERRVLAGMNEAFKVYPINV